MRQVCRAVDSVRLMGSDLVTSLSLPKLQSWFATKATTASRDRDAEVLSERRRNRRSSKRRLREWAQDMNFKGRVYEFVHSAKTVNGEGRGKGEYEEKCRAEHDGNDFWKYLLSLSTYKGRATVHRAWNKGATCNSKKQSSARGDSEKFSKPPSWESSYWSGFEGHDYKGFFFQDRHINERIDEDQQAVYKQRLRLPEGMRENLTLLQLDPTRVPTAARVKQAFIKFAMHNHPDRYADDPAGARRAEENFKKVNAAYHTLLTQISNFQPQRL